MRLPSPRILSLLILSLLLCGCAGGFAEIPCHRYEGSYLGPENQLQGVVPNDQIPELSGARDRMVVSMSMLAPTDGSLTRATLIQTVDGRDVVRWNLRIPRPRGMAARCVLGTKNELSNCGASISDLPFQPGGQYRLRSSSGRIVEAGISFHVCR